MATKKTNPMLKTLGIGALIAGALWAAWYFLIREEDPGKQESTKPGTRPDIEGIKDSHSTPGKNNDTQVQAMVRPSRNGTVVNGQPVSDYVRWQTANMGGNCVRRKVYYGGSGMAASDATQYGNWEPCP